LLLHQFARRHYTLWTYSTFPAYSVKTQASGAGDTEGLFTKLVSCPQLVIVVTGARTETGL